MFAIPYGICIIADIASDNLILIIVSQDPSFKKIAPIYSQITEFIHFL